MKWSVRLDFLSALNALEALKAMKSRRAARRVAASGDDLASMGTAFGLDATFGPSEFDFPQSSDQNPPVAWERRLARRSGLRRDL